MRNDEEAPRPLRPVGQRSQQLVGRYFDENAGRTGNPIPTIIVGDHVVPAAMPRRSTTTRCSAPSRTPRCCRVPVSKICVNYLGHQGTNEWAGVPTDQDARPADSVADALGGFVSSGVAPSCY
jgi:hypothetical protein